MEEEHLPPIIVDDARCKHFLMADNFALFLAKTDTEYVAVGVSGPRRWAPQIMAQNILCEARKAGKISGNAKILHQIAPDHPVTEIPASPDGGFAVKTLIHFVPRGDDAYQTLYVLPRLPEKIVEKASKAARPAELQRNVPDRRENYFKSMPRLVM